MVVKKNTRKNPAISIMFKMCKDPAFQQGVNDLRDKWGISKLTGSGDEADKLWNDLCEADSRDPEYHRKYENEQTQAQIFKHDLETLYPKLPSDQNVWLLMYEIVMRINLNVVTESDLMGLPLLSSIARISILRQNNRLYLDVTFATLKDVQEIWRQVTSWQDKVRPFLIKEIDGGPLLKKRQLLPNLLKDIKQGRPAKLTDEVCRKAARLKDKEKWTYPQIGKFFDWACQESAFNKAGKVTRSRCRTAEEAVKRGRKLKQ